MESVASFHGSWNSVHLHIKSETFSVADFVRLTVLARSCRALSDQLLAEQCCGRLLRMLIFQRERPGHRQWQCYFRFRVSQILTAQWAGSTRVRFWMFARVLLFIANRLQNILTVKPAKVRSCTNFIATEEKKLQLGTLPHAWWRLQESMKWPSTISCWTSKLETDLSASMSFSGCILSLWRSKGW